MLLTVFKTTVSNMQTFIVIVYFLLQLYHIQCKVTQFSAKNIMNKITMYKLVSIRILCNSNDQVHNIRYSGNLGNFRIVKSTHWSFEASSNLKINVTVPERLQSTQRKAVFGIAFVNRSKFLIVTKRGNYSKFNSFESNYRKHHQYV